MKAVMLFFFVLLIPLVSASDDIEVSHETITGDIEPGGTSTFKLSIKNLQYIDDTFSLMPDELGTYPFSEIIDYVIIEPSELDLASHAKKHVIVKIKTRDNAPPDKNYKTFVRIKSLRNPDIKEDYYLTFGVEAPSELIRITTDLSETLNPGKKTDVKIEFRNNANLILENVDFYITSPQLNEQFSEKMFPYQEISKQFTLVLDPTTKPENYPISIRAYIGESLKGKWSKEISIVPNPNIEEKINTYSGFFVKTLSISLTNNGNTVINQLYRLPLSKSQQFITNFNIEPTEKKDSHLKWSFIIEPGETYTIIARTDYRPLTLVVILLLVAIFLFVYWGKTGVNIEKTVFRVKNHKGPELKIMLHVRNRSGYRIKNAKIIEIIPHLINIQKEFGTLHPAEIQKGEKSTRIIWNIEKLESKEERIISYMIKPNLHILGKLVLPPALLRYRNKANKMVNLKSNRSSFDLKE